MKQNCNKFEPLAKQTVLAMLQAPSTQPVKPGQIVWYTNTSGITYELVVSAVGGGNVTLSTPSGPVTVPRSQVKTNAKPCVLDNIPLDSWRITSFDSSSRLVCIDVTTPSGVRHLNVTLPAITFTAS